MSDLSRRSEAKADDDSNVIVLPPRQKAAAPPLRNVAIFMDPKTCGLEMELIDTDGNVVAMLAYDLVYAPPGFDLNELRELWDRYRGRPVNSAS